MAWLLLYIIKNHLFWASRIRWVFARTVPSRFQKKWF